MLQTAGKCGKTACSGRDFRNPLETNSVGYLGSIGVDLAGILGGRIARAEGGLVPSGVG